MKKYIVYAKYTSYCYVEVEASSARDAELVADEMDGGDFTPSDIPMGNWEIVPEMTRELRGDEK